MTPLVQRIAAGEQEAMQECIDRYGNLVWTIARRFLRDTHTAEDAVQEIFLSLWNSAQRFDPEVASESTFIAMIARRRLIDLRRKGERRPETEPLPETFAETMSNDPEPSSAHPDEERALGAFRQLDESTQQLLNLSIHLGYTQQEISSRLKLPLGTVKTKLRRGLTKMRNTLARGATNQGAQT